MSNERASVGDMARPTHPDESDLLLPFERGKLRGDYKEYFKTKRNNFFATIQAFPQLWGCFLLHDDIWLREFDDLGRLQDPNQMLPVSLFIHAHSQSRIALELGFSCCIGEAWNVVRSGIEAVGHACKIMREPHLGPVWLQKEDGPAEAKAFNRAFQQSKKESLFSPHYGLGKLYEYWSNFSEWGTHTTVGSLGKRMAFQETATDLNSRLEYFEADRKRLATFLYSLVDASYCMEKAFFGAFTRLNLDPELAKMRNRFEAQKQATAQRIIRRFRLTPPTIWA